VLGLIKIKEGKINYKTNLRVGYMPQKLFINPILPLSVERFLRLSPYKGCIEEVLELVGIFSLRNNFLHNLSGGEMQRVLLARAIMRNPELLVLDEPTQGLDIVGQGKFYELIRALKERFKCGVILVSHDLHLVFKSSEHVICLNKHICCEGRPEEVRNNPEYYRLFPTKIPDDLAFYHHEHDHHHL
jgi:zinc transport system ATP-binding protein